MIGRNPSMINSVVFTGGYPQKLPGIRKKPIQFSPRLNVLYGPNGNGKTTIIRTLAHGSDLLTEALPYPYMIEKDPSPVFYFETGTLVRSDFFLARPHLRSSGETQAGAINAFITEIEERFPLYKLSTKNRPVLLIDEIDHHIGFGAQHILWRSIIPELARKYQVIVSSHSIFPILLQKHNILRDDKIIELHPDYIRYCIDSLANSIDFYKQQAQLEDRKLFTSL